MRIAYLNLCHCDPVLVARAAKKLTADEHFDMYVHVDLKTELAPFEEALREINRVFLIEKRYKVYWGGFQAVLATLELLRAALDSGRSYDRYVILQNLDYPIKSNVEILNFFENHQDLEFIRGCKIARTKDWHFAEKYKIVHHYDGDDHLRDGKKLRRILHNSIKYVRSIPNLLFDGIIRETDGAYPIYYGAAQWSVTDACARYMLKFSESHDAFNQRMQKVKFPDEMYFQTIVHNSPFCTKCVGHPEPVKRWLVNWRNLHYFEYPKEVITFTEKDFHKLMEREELFCRKVGSGISDRLLDQIDEATNG